ncbi:putative fasciclin-like arabinogalactan protein 20 [Cicer arietinum]|uniref:Fasciclin-like arabinogalactan protein 20 n=1 Tax=Cicer arietinum TaxID=3827 RepID=A0A1S2Z1I0_CICAR|nr:putative fasciclin-like arabinogalactan protein 20 [Cicer arietinum]
MGLTLRLASPSLPTTTSAIIFVPSDTAFRRHGSLPLSLLQYHIIPSKFPLQYLTSLPVSTPLPTLLPYSHLTITSNSLSTPHLSINNITVSTTPLFETPFLLILTIHDFFNSSSLFLPEPTPEPLLRVLQSNNCSAAAAFLETVFPEFTDGTKLTVFAPPDEAVRNVTVLRKHVVRGLITWRDLIRLPGGTLLPSLFDGFDIKVTVFPRLRLVNGVKVIAPDMYRGEFVVVHRVDGLLDNGMV